MIWAIVLVGTVLVVGAAVTAIVSPAKLVVGLLGTGVIVSVAFVALTITSSVGGSGPMGGFSHSQLEADRIMTQQMASVVGPGMESQMTTDRMLERSANDAYLRALEQHTYQVDRMLGRVP
jgi:hypothetical protein